MVAYYNEYSKVYVSVDCIVFGFEEGHLRILIGKRKMDPGRGEWSLYGGFVGNNESLNDAANRVLYDLTGMEGIYMKQAGAYGEVNRDPGDRVISVAYWALINVKDYDEHLREQYGLEWVNIDELPQLYSDHNRMVEKALRMMRKRISTEPISFNLLPELFTLTQLQNVYEAVCHEEVDKRNFRKRIKEMDFIEKTEKIDKKSSKRGAALYRFNEKSFSEDPNFKL